jgi:hypothetical protein
MTTRAKGRGPQYELGHDDGYAAGYGTGFNLGRESGVLLCIKSIESLSNHPGRTVQEKNLLQMAIRLIREEVRYE